MTLAVSQAPPHSFSSSYAKINLFGFYVFLVYLEDIVAFFSKSVKWMICDGAPLWASGSNYFSVNRLTCVYKLSDALASNLSFPFRLFVGVG